VEQPWRDRRAFAAGCRRSLGAGAMLAGGQPPASPGGATFRYAGIDRALVTGEHGGSAYVVARFDARRGRVRAQGSAAEDLVIGDSFGQTS
jgi:hypothetical protein